jgi:hypothetical protein
MANNRNKNRNKKSARRSSDYNANRNYYYKKKEMIPHDKCYALVENEMIIHRFLVNLPDPNDVSRGAFEHWYLLRKLSDEIARCYRMIYNDVKERNRGYELPSFPEMSKEMREMFEMLS